MQLQLGLEVIQSYKRLAYTAWHAIAEFVDNSTESYFNNKEQLDLALKEEGTHLTVSIVYDRMAGVLRVSDNAMGMSGEELQTALRVGIPPAITSGRSQYGMGLKTAACWVGNCWTIQTTKLGDPELHHVTVDVNAVSAGEPELQYSVGATDIGSHYTIVEIHSHNRSFQGRTLGKIQDFLRSMYRQDLRDQLISIRWQNNELYWDDSEFIFVSAPDGSPYKNNFDFEVNGKRVYGWAGVLRDGGRGKAGFSILRANRVIKGWPDSWRPEPIFGFQGRNDLINQRFLGEIHLDEFEVSHTKDDILWLENEEDDIGNLLKGIFADHLSVARKPRRGTTVDGGPTDLELRTAIEQLESELSSPEFATAISLDTVLPPIEAISSQFQRSASAATRREPTFRAQSNQLEILGYLIGDGSPNDPYVVVESTHERRVMVIVNIRHPHWDELRGPEGTLNYLRHCTYDAVAEWQARRLTARLDPDTIKTLKDRLPRLPMETLMHEQ